MNPLSQPPRKEERTFDDWLFRLWKRTSKSLMVETAITINENYAIDSGNNGISVSPATIATGVTVTIPTGSTWLIVV